MINRYFYCTAYLCTSKKPICLLKALNTSLFRKDINLVKKNRKNVNQEFKYKYKYKNKILCG